MKCILNGLLLPFSFSRSLPDEGFDGCGINRHKVGGMESEKLQRLHDTLAKLAPRGKVGGLGYSSFVKQVSVVKALTLLSSILICLN